MKMGPPAFGIALTALLSGGIVHAALMHDKPLARQHQILADVRVQAASAVNPSKHTQLAGMLLMDDAMLPDPENSAGDAASAIDGDIQVKQIKQESRPNRGNKQQANVGVKTNSSTTGQVRTRGLVSKLSQQQSGRNNRQTMNVGAISNSRASGSIKSKSHVSHGSQHQTGISNNQGMNFGSVR